MDQEINTQNLNLSWADILSFIAYFLFISFLTGINVAIFMIIWGFEELIETWLDGYIGILLGELTLVLAVITFKKFKAFCRGIINIKKVITARFWIVLSLGMIAVYILDFIIRPLFTFEDPSKNPANAIPYDTSLLLPEKILIVFAIAIVTPILEELLFRGILYRFLAFKYNVFIGLILSSVVFGLLHPGYFLSAALFGVITVLVYKYTNSLLSAIIIHATFNFIALLPMFLN